MERIYYVIASYLVIVNIIGFVLMAIDKSKARKNQWRVPEKTLFFMAIIGGSIGSILGMKTFRHKTKHKSFVIGMPLIFILQSLLVIIVYLYK